MAGVTETCVYTIVHTDTLDRSHEAGGVASFHEGRRWATAEDLLAVARKQGLRVPVVFAAAEFTADLIYFGWLEAVVLGANGAEHATTFLVSGLMPFRKPYPKKTSLIVASTGNPIPASHIRPYVLCRTPEFVRMLRPSGAEKVDLGPLTLFSWGYWGWGNATNELVQAVDAGEAMRGFGPPIFVDIRIRRNVRAKGFTGDTFERTVGRDRYRWIQDLGNESVLTGGGPTRIKNPKAASRLLDLALEAAEQRQRLLFFCACEFPISAGSQCHRVDVADLALAEAERRGTALIIQEWPGGEPTKIRLHLDDKERRRVLAGAPSVRVDGQLGLGFAASIPWGSSLILNDGDHEQMLTGPVMRSTNRWVLPITRSVQSGNVLQREFGYGARTKNGCRAV
jgi:hypothetical protein